MIKKVKFEQFTAFENLEVNCSSGINIIVGANGTGKTHILKTIYAACDVSKTKRNFAEKITKVFLPSGDQIGRLIKRGKKSVAGSAEVTRVGKDSKEIKLKLSFSNHTTRFDKAKITGTTKWIEHDVESVYIPVKEMLSNAPGFRSLYTGRQVAFEEVYADIVDRALLPLLKGPPDVQRKKILEILKKEMDGNVSVQKEEFFLHNRQGMLEFTLLAEGLRKLALIWILIQNGTLLKGSVLCWDEPEANLNPRLMKTVVGILLELQRMGVQVFISTHDYVLLKEFDLQTTKTDHVIFHSLYRDGEIFIKTSAHYFDLHPNAIADTFTNLYDRDIERALGGKNDV